MNVKRWVRRGSDGIVLYGKGEHDTILWMVKDAWHPFDSLLSPLRTCLVSHSGDYYINPGCWGGPSCGCWSVTGLPSLSFSIVCVVIEEFAKRSCAHLFFLLVVIVSVWAICAWECGGNLTFLGDSQRWLIACQSAYSVRSFRGDLFLVTGEDYYLPRPKTCVFQLLQETVHRFCKQIWVFSSRIGKRIYP